MATRFYLPSTGTAPITPSITTGWETITSFTAFPTDIVKSNTTLVAGAGRVKSGTTANADRLDRIFVSPPLAAQTIAAGTFSAVIRAVQSAATTDAWLQIMIRVVSNDGTTERGMIYSGSTATTESATVGNEAQEYGTTSSTRIKNAIATSAVTAQSGDRLQIEIGTRINGTTSTDSFTHRYGDETATADFALTAGLTTDLCPWVELSQTLTFAATAQDANVSGSGTLAQTATPTLSATVAPSGDGALSASGYQNPLIEENYEGGTAGAAITTSNTVHDAATTGTTFSNAITALQGSLALRIDAPAATGQRYVQNTFAETDVWYARWYQYLPTLPNENVDFNVIRGAGAIRARFGSNNAGTNFIIRNANTTLWTSTMTIPTGAWYRVEWMVNYATSTQELRLFTGSNLNGTTPTETSGAQTFNIGTLDEVRMGPVNNFVTVAWVAYYDAVKQSETGWVGPLAVGTVTQSGTASGSGTLSATAIPSATVSAGPNGSGTLSVGTLNTTRSVGLAGSGTLSATTTYSLTAAGSPAGSGTLSQSALPSATSTGALSGTGTLTAGTDSTQVGTGPLSGDGTLSATSSWTATRAAGLSGAGTLFADADGSFRALMSSMGELTADGLGSITGSGASTSSGTLSAEAEVLYSANVSLGGSGTGVALPQFLVDLASDGTLASDVASAVLALALSGSGLLEAQNAADQHIAGPLSGVGVLTAHIPRVIHILGIHMRTLVISTRTRVLVIRVEER